MKAKNIKFDPYVYCWLEFHRIEKDHGFKAATLVLTKMKQEYGIVDPAGPEWASAKEEARSLLEFEGLL